MAPTGRLAALPPEATQAPSASVTGAPLLSAALAAQVALVAATRPTLAQTRLPVTTEPGALTAGRPLNVGVMSETVATAATVSVAVSQTVALGAGAQTW